MVSYKNMLAFIHAAESTTFAEAAEKLHVTQPALSSAIKKMEQQIGGLLFSRTTRRVELTPEGQTFLPTAKRLVSDWDEAIQDMQNLFAMNQGTLRIAAMPSFAESRLPISLKQYHKRWPNIRIRVMDVVMEDVIDAVLSGRAELGFTFEPDNMDGLEFSPIGQDQFIGVVPPNHPLSSAESVDWKTLLSYPFVAMNRESAVRRWTEDIAQAVGPLKIIAETSQLGSLGQLIAQGLGISVVPALCQQQMERKGLLCLPIDDKQLVKSVGIIRRQRGSVSIAAQALWDQCL